MARNVTAQRLPSPAVDPLSFVLCKVRPTFLERVATTHDLNSIFPHRAQKQCALHSCLGQFKHTCTISHLCHFLVVSWVGLTFCIMSNQLPLCLMSTLGVSYFASCRLLRSPSTSAWVSLSSEILRVEYLAPTWQRYHHLSAAHDRNTTVVSSRGKCILAFYVCLFPDDNISDVICSCFSLYHLSIFISVVYIWFLLIFSYRPTFPTMSLRV